MKIKDLAPSPLLENVAAKLAGVEELPGYDSDEEWAYVQKVLPVYKVMDPLDPSVELLPFQDLATLGMISYQSVLAKEPPEETLASINEFRNIFYKARLAIKYPRETASDPSYQEALQNMLEIYHMIDNTYDPLGNTEIGGELGKFS